MICLYTHQYWFSFYIYEKSSNLHQYLHQSSRNRGEKRGDPLAFFASSWLKPFNAAIAFALVLTETKGMAVSTTANWSTRSTNLRRWKPWQPWCPLWLWSTQQNLWENLWKSKQMIHHEIWEAPILPKMIFTNFPNSVFITRAGPIITQSSPVTVRCFGSGVSQPTALDALLGWIEAPEAHLHHLMVHRKSHWAWLAWLMVHRKIAI